MPGGPVTTGLTGVSLAGAVLMAGFWSWPSVRSAPQPSQKLENSSIRCLHCGQFILASFLKDWLQFDVARRKLADLLDVRVGNDAGGHGIRSLVRLNRSIGLLRSETYGNNAAVN